MRATAERPSDSPAECSRVKSSTFLVFDEASIIDQANLDADAFAQRRCQLFIEQPRNVQSTLGSAADLRRGPEQRVRSCVDGTARKRSPCSAAETAISAHGSGTPAWATSSPRSNTAHASDRFGVAGAAQIRADRRGATVRQESLKRLSLRDALAPASARPRCSGADPRAPLRRRAARATCPADPPGRAASRSRKLKCRRRRSTTIATLISAIHTPRLAREVSSCRRSRSCWMRDNIDSES